MNSKGDISAQLARQSFGLFAKAVFPSLIFSPFHAQYYRVLHAFATGRIKRLIVTVPPQHGKSQGSTRLLPAYMLGRNPDLRIAIASYSDTFAKKFNRDIQRIIDTPEYHTIFPDTTLNGSTVAPVSSSYLRNSSEFEIVGHNGSLKAVGRGGGLTGNQVDVMVMDDLYKDAMEGNSPTIREAAWEWYTSVVRTRLHNDSQELIVFTRWHEDDLIGRIEKTEQVYTISNFDEIDDIPQGQDVWVKINFEAVKTDAPTPLDSRPMNTPLWGERHSLESLQAKRKLDPHTFECMYQGHPAAREGFLYSGFKTYDQLPAPSEIVSRSSYIDTADTGEDYLCAVAYVKARDGYCYVVDIVYTQAAMEETETATANMLERNDIRLALVESNNGGRGFARTIQRLAPRVRVEWFHQSGNKESRILTNAPTVQQNILFPSDWVIRWSEFYEHLTTFKRLFRANIHDDAPDAVTGVVEKEYLQKKKIIVYG